MPRPLSEQTIAVVKATVPALEQHGLAITETMYRQTVLFQRRHGGLYDGDGLLR